MVGVIDLATTRSPGLIVLDENGLWYSNQAGGTLCAHPQAKGFYLPLDGRVWGLDEEPDVEAITGSWGTRAELPDWDFEEMELPGLRKATGSEVAAHAPLLRTRGFGEAWYPVVICDPHAARHILPVDDPKPLRDRVCIFTWMNSD